MAVASKWYLAYLVTYYFTFIYTAIIDSIIGSIATCNIKKRCLCPSIFDSQGCHSISKDFQSAFDIDILFIFIYTAIIGILTGSLDKAISISSNFITACINGFKLYWVIILKTLV